MPESDVPDGLVFRKSSYSGPDGCVEVGLVPGGGATVVVRSSWRRDHQQLLFTQAEWDAFVRGVKDGEFDIPIPRS